MFGPVKVEELGMPEGQPWPSELHKIVAQHALGFNEQVNELEDLRRFVAIICQYDVEQLKIVTGEELRKQGIPI